MDRGFRVALTIAVVLASGAVVRAEFLLSDQGSEIYFSYAVVAGTDIHLDKDVEIHGAVRSNDDVDLRQGSVVAGDVFAVDRISGPGTILGFAEEGVPPVSLPLLEGSELEELADVVYEGDKTWSDLMIDQVVFVTGDVRVEGRVSGVGTLIATGNVSFDKDGGNSHGGEIVLDDETRISVISLGSIKIGKNRPFRGALRAAKDVTLEKEVTFEGVIAADRKVHVKKDSGLSFVDFDAVPPVVAVSSPQPGAFSSDSRPVVTATVEDEFSGIDPGSLELRLDGVDHTADVELAQNEIAWTPAEPLTDGVHELVIVVRDRSANETLETVTFTVDTGFPVLAIDMPADGDRVRAPTIRVQGTVSDLTPIVGLTVDRQPASVDGEAFAGAAALRQGVNTVTVTATDSVGHESSASVAVTLDSQPPDLTVLAPLPGEVTNNPTMRFAGEVYDALGLASLEVDGAVVAVDEDTFEVEIPIPEGSSTAVVRATDLAGNVSERSVDVRRITVPDVTILEPEGLRLVTEDTVEVVGTVSDAAATVLVDGVPVPLAAGMFTAQVPIVPGVNVIDVAATGPFGGLGTAKVSVFRDASPPRITVYDPEDGAVVHEPVLSVCGLVNDVSLGTVRGGGRTTVTVNGLPALTSHRGFLLEEVPLDLGPNTITVEAVDPSGNVATATIQVSLEPPKGPSIEVVSGSLQTAAIGGTLAEPLIARLVDAAGEPVAGKPVVFEVTGNNGHLGGDRRQAAVATDGDGRAAVTFTAGTRAGAGSQRVEASAAGFAGRAVFLATALPGAPEHLLVDSGNQQVGATGAWLPDPFVAVVTDAGFNRLEGVAVAFQVVKGRGSFADGSGEVVVSSDENGRAGAALRLDSEEGVGNNVVEARLVELPDVRLAAFVASGRAVGDPAQTSISGIVLDNTDLPVPEVTVHVAGTSLSAVSDDQGIFRIPGAPAGSILLAVDGSTTSRSGVWPHLEFPMTTVPGRDNTLGRPIYLLPLGVDRGLPVSETEGGTLTLPELPGFSLEIAPGSVTFPDGSRSGQVAVTLVHSDKVPMVPNFGQQPRFVITIQPGGARFDPPAAMTIPNVDGLAPGETTELYSFDHDLMSFLSIGPGTVSEDGTRVVSDPGVGVVEAGWHSGGNPPPTGTPHDCPLCQSASASACFQGCFLPGLDSPGDQPAVFTDKACNCSGDAPCKFNYRCVDGKCKSDKVKVTEVTGPCLVEVGSPATFTATGNFPAKARWRARGGEPSSGVGASFTTTFDSVRRREVGAGCRGGGKSTTVDVVSSCGEIMPELIEPEIPSTPDPDSAGTVRHARSRTARYTGCGHGQRWCFRLAEYRETHEFAIASLTDEISGPQDPDVTPAKCAAIIADLTPRGTTIPPPRTKYWSRDITIEHERYHVNEYSSLVTQNIFVGLEAFVGQDDHCTDCVSSAPLQLFNAKIDELVKAWEPMFADGDQEPRAHKWSNQLYGDLIAEIRQRARDAPPSEGWPQECK